MDGAANTAVVVAVARWLGLSPRDVRLVSGATSRTKIVEVETTVALPPSDVTP